MRDRAREALSRTLSDSNCTEVEEICLELINSYFMKAESVEYDILLLVSALEMTERLLVVENPCCFGSKGIKSINSDVLLTLTRYRKLQPKGFRLSDGHRSLEKAVVCVNICVGAVALLVPDNGELA